jgi:hypothetical protein
VNAASRWPLQSQCRRERIAAFSNPSKFATYDFAEAFVADFNNGSKVLRAALLANLRRISGPRCA